MEALFTFKGVEECKNTTRCHTLALEISLDDIKRAKTNLQYRYNKIDPVNWTPATISTHREQQNTLLSLISVFDEFSAEMFRKSDLMITAIESLSNKIFPEDLLSSVPGVCNDTSLYEGEAYYVKHCTGCKSGYQCVVQTDTPAATTQVTTTTPYQLFNAEKVSLEVAGLTVQYSGIENLATTKIRNTSIPVEVLHSFQQKLHFLQYASLLAPLSLFDYGILSFQGFIVIILAVTIGLKCRKRKRVRPIKQLKYPRKLVPMAPLQRTRLSPLLTNL